MMPLPVRTYPLAYIDYHRLGGGKLTSRSICDFFFIKLARKSVNWLCQGVGLTRRCLCGDDTLLNFSLPDYPASFNTPTRSYFQYATAVKLSGGKFRERQPENI